MLKVGLTGGIASGKTSVGEMLVALGAHLVQADRIAHQLMLPGQPVYNEVVRHFGGAILNPDLSVNRAKLAEAALAVAAIGGTAEVMEHVASGGYEMVGTFNGNPLAMAGARAMLCEVATPAAYQRIEELRARAVSGIEEVIADRGLPAHVVSAGAKGCVVFLPDPVRDYRGFLGIHDRYSHAHWLFQHNGGVFLPPGGKIEQWLISVQHEPADIDRLVGNLFATFATAIVR